MRQRLTAIFSLQACAITLASVQMWVGLRTDEAKYLLNIPYPHPPLLRWIMNLTESETLWRLIWATLFIQAVWLVWDMARTLPKPSRIAVSLSWLLAAGVITQAGAVMISPINALQALVLVWLLCRPSLVAKYPVVVALFWTAMLFSGYQAVLYLPLAIALFWRMRKSFIDVFVYSLLPVGLLALYTISNPFAVATIIRHGGEQSAAIALTSKLFHTARLLLIGGSVVVTITGIVGMVTSCRREFLISFILILAYVFLMWSEYYSILFTPLLVMGTLMLLEWKPQFSKIVMFLLPLGTVLILFLFPFAKQGSAAREVMKALRNRNINGTILINGDFGHEWQFESRNVIRRYASDFEGEADAIVCIQPCPDAEGLKPMWQRVDGTTVETWVRTQTP